MEEDYTELCCLVNAWDAYNEEHRERSRARLRQLLLDMVDKGPKHLIGIFKLYLQTHQIEEDESSSVI
jgi:hypothetical protein